MIPKIQFVAFLTTWVLATYDPKSSVVDLSPIDFDSKVINNNKVWLVQYYDPKCDFCLKFMPAYLTIANSLKGVVKVGAVNLNKYPSMKADMNISYVPTVFVYGYDKQRPIKYTLGKRVESIIHVVMIVITDKVMAQHGKGAPLDKETPSKATNVYELTDENFDNMVIQDENTTWMVDFTPAAWCDPHDYRCEYDKPSMEKPAAQLKGRVKFGTLDSGVHENITTIYNNLGYPVMLLFPLGQKFLNNTIRYNGIRTADKITEWVLVKLTGKTPIKLIHVRENVDFRYACGLLHPYCIIVFIPPIKAECDENCRMQYIQILKDVGEKFYYSSWSWLWSEYGAQDQLDLILENPKAPTLPSVVAIDSRLEYIVRHNGPYDNDSLATFFNKLSDNDDSLIRVGLKQVPSIRYIAPWEPPNPKINQRFDNEL